MLMSAPAFSWDLSELSEDREREEFSAMIRNYEREQYNNDMQESMDRFSQEMKDEYSFS